MKPHRYNWLPDFVYGGIDGAVTTFAVVAGVAGAHLSTSIVLILGFANLFADGFSMAVGKFSSDRAEKQRIQSIRKELDRDIHHHPKSQREELARVLALRGFKGNDLKKAVQVISSNEKIWVETMMTHKHRLIDSHINPMKGGVATFTAFLLVGMIPLLAYVLNPFVGMEDAQLFELTSLLTLAALFVVGAVRGKVVKENWLFSGIEVVVIGGLAATIAYLVGYALQNIG